MREAARISSRSSSSLYMVACATGSEPSTGLTSGRWLIRPIRKRLGQVSSMPSSPGSTAAASWATGSSLSVCSTISRPSCGAMANSLLPKKVTLPSSRMYSAIIRSIGETQMPVR